MTGREDLFSAGKAARAPIFGLPSRPALSTFQRVSMRTARVGWRKTGRPNRSEIRIMSKIKNGLLAGLHFDAIGS